MPRPRKHDEASKYASVVKEMSGNRISQRDIAKALNISQSTVSRLLASAPVTAVDHLQAIVDARSGYSQVAQQRHDAYHAESVARVAELTGKLAEIESRDLFRGHEWSGITESDELCKFFSHGDDPWS